MILRTGDDQYVDHHHMEQLWSIGVHLCCSVGWDRSPSEHLLQVLIQTFQGFFLPVHSEHQGCAGRSIFPQGGATENLSAFFKGFASFWRILLWLSLWKLDIGAMLLLQICRFFGDFLLYFEGVPTGQSVFLESQKHKIVYCHFNLHKMWCAHQ